MLRKIKLQLEDGKENHFTKDVKMANEHIKKVQ